MTSIINSEINLQTATMKAISKSRINLFTKIILVMVICLSSLSNRLEASHAMGMDLTYECLGGNQYEFTLNFYRDCSGTTAPASLSISIGSVTCAQSSTLLLTQVGAAVDISPLCPSATSNCSGGINPGVEHYVYTGIYTLPANCPDWKFTYSLCCRNPGITNLVSPSSQALYVESTLNNSSGLCNSSPNFTTLPVPYICKDQLTSYGLGAIDSEGDSIVFSLVNALGAGADTLVYVAPYSPSYPITTDSGFVSFDIMTGNLNLTPDTTQTCIVTVLVEEYRNGVLIGSIMRDIQLLVLSCGANTQPFLTSPLITNLTGGAALLDSNSIEVCVGVPVNFELTALDVDAGDSIIFTTNLATSIPSAIFDTTGVNPVAATFSWTPLAADIGLNTFTATIQDNFCPIVGKQTYVFDIRVVDGVYAGPDITQCGVDSIQLSASGSLNYMWSPGTGLSDSTISNPMALVTSTTTYIITGDSSGACKYIDTVVVVLDTSNFVTINATSNDICGGDTVQLSVTGSPGLPLPASWTYAWTPTASLSDTTVAAPSAYPPDTTTFTVSVVNSCGTFTDSIVINTHSAPPADAGLDTSYCFGGSVQITATGGAFYLWSPNLFLSCTACDKTTATPSSDMMYYVLVTDSFGCTAMDSVLVEVKGLPISASSVPAALCSSADSVMLEVSGSIDITDDFDPGVDGSVWTNIVNGTVGVGCGTVTGNSLHFDNGPTRFAETIDLNVTGGGSIDFWLTIGTTVSPCEQADPGEDVVLEYSTNGGLLWVNMNTYITNLYPTFTLLSEPIPVAAQSASTRFRWNQPNFSNCNCDNWAIDEMVINTVGGTLDSTTIVNWTPGITLDDSTSLTPMATPGGPMTYTVTVDDGGCITSSSITVILDTTLLTLTGDTAICLGTSGLIGVTSNTATTSYLWTPSVALSDSSLQFPIASPTSTMTYAVAVTNAEGCVFSDSMVVTVDTLPTSGFSALTSDLSALFSNSSVNATSYFWDFGDGFLASVAAPTHTYNANGAYNVCLIAVNYCGTDTFCSIVTVSLAGCVNTTAAFDTATVDLTAVFTDLSTEVTSWAWDFGDGGSSISQNPVYTYAAPGTYNVCLITSNACSSDTSCVTMVITTSQPCLQSTAAFTSNSVGLAVVFLDASTNATSWFWNFGDGNTSVAQNPVNTYAADGTYNVCLISTNFCSSDTTCVSVTVAAAACPPALAAFTSSATGLDVSFTDNSTDPSSWLWDFGDGFSSTDQNTSHIYALPGTYTVCLMVGNPCSADTSCASITILACTSPTAAFTSSTSSLTATFADGSTNATSWSWDFGDGNSSIAQNPTYSYATAGSYVVCLTAITACSTDVYCDTITVTLCAEAVAAYTYTDTLLDVYFTDMSLNAATWSWDFGDGNTSTSQNSSNTYTLPGTYNVCLTSSNACSSDNVCFVVTVVTVGMEETMASKMEIYPNPTDGVLNVLVPSNLGSDMSLIIYNVVGEVVFSAQQSELNRVNSSKNHVQYSLELGFLANGSYLLKVQSKEKLFMEQVIFSK